MELKEVAVDVKERRIFGNEANQQYSNRRESEYGEEKTKAVRDAVEGCQ